VYSEDRKLLDYGSFIRERDLDYESTLTQLQSEVDNSQRNNQKLKNLITDAHKSLRKK
jgi:hypothetical protein